MRIRTCKGSDPFPLQNVKLDQDPDPCQREKPDQDQRDADPLQCQFLARFLDWEELRQKSQFVRPAREEKLKEWIAHCTYIFKV